MFRLFIECCIRFMSFKSRFMCNCIFKVRSDVLPSSQFLCDSFVYFGDRGRVPWDGSGKQLIYVGYLVILAPAWVMLYSLER